MKMRNKITAFAAVTALFVLNSCTKVVEAEDIDIAANGIVLTESGSGSGTFGAIDTNYIYSQGITIHSNTVVTVANEDVYILERKGAENIIRLNEDGSVKYQEHIVDGYSAQAIAITDFGKGYVCGLKSDQLYTFDLETGKVTDSINISGFNNPTNATVPSAGGMVIVGDNLYVGMQRFEDDNWTPTVVSQVAVINIISDEIVDTIDCKGYNFAQFVVDGTDIYVLNTGDSYGTKENSSIEKIDTKDNSIVKLTEALLNDSPITALAHKGGNEFYASSYVGWGTVPVTLIDITTATAIGSSIEGVTSSFGGIQYDKRASVLYIGEYDDVAFGVLKYDVNSEVMTKIETTLKPSSIALK